MLFKNLAFISSLAALATAQLPDGATFGLVAIHSTSPVHNQGIKARQGRLWIGGAQGAECEQPSEFATFTIEEDGLYLYAVPELTQQLWVERSGMGQGITGYTTGDQTPPRNAERGPFAVNAEGRLQFDGTDFVACPTSLGDGSYTLWLSGVQNPGGNKDCVGIALRAMETKKPVSCHYTE